MKSLRSNNKKKLSNFDYICILLIKFNKKKLFFLKHNDIEQAMINHLNKLFYVFFTVNLHQNYICFISIQNISDFNIHFIISKIFAYEYGILSRNDLSDDFFI